MPTLIITSTRDHLQAFDFKQVFIHDLGWSQPTSQKDFPFEVNGVDYSRREIAQLGGVPVFEVSVPEGSIPEKKTRQAIHSEVFKHSAEHLLIFVNADRSQSVWQWVKRDGGKHIPREHFYFKGQPGDLFLSKLSAMVFELKDFDADGDVGVLEVAGRLKNALDIEKVTKKFFVEFQKEHTEFLELIKGIKDERDRKWYASVMLNRMMFIYFLQKKYFLDGGDDLYLQNKLAISKKAGKDKYFSEFLQSLFFEGFALPEGKRTAATNQLLGKIKYLNGGLFVKHPIEERWPDIKISDKAFDNLFGLFAKFSWNLNDTPGGDDNTLNPDVLGYIFEKYINQKQFGAYYTRTEFTEFNCERTVHSLILDRVNESGLIGGMQFDSIGEMLARLDRKLCAFLLVDVLPTISILDPACGSGAFLVAALKALIIVYTAVVGWVEMHGDKNLKLILDGIKGHNKNIGYGIKKKIITDNLFGVDIMEEATEIAKLRLFLTLVASAESVDQLEPLPNIDFNILAGNSLIGLMRVNDEKFNTKGQLGLFHEGGKRKYTELVTELNRDIRNYRNLAQGPDDLRVLRNSISGKKTDASAILNEMLLEEFALQKIGFEEATWDDKKHDEGKPKKRPLKIEDIEKLKPFHWGFEFDEILNTRGGFDAIITNPPWEIFKPYSKEFFEEHSELVTRKNMSIKDFEKEQTKLLRDPDIRKAWLNYLSGYPHVSAFFRSADQYKNQISVVNGKKQGTDINLYKLFVEQCYNLLRHGGRCGILTPAGIYSDLGTTQLRALLFSETEIDSLFGFANERYLFEGVDHRQKFCILTFAKKGAGKTFECAFRINPREAVAPDQLYSFLHDHSQHLTISVDLVRRLSPDSFAVMEFKSPIDVQIAEKLGKVQPLGDERPGIWSVKFSREFDMTNDSHLFHSKVGKYGFPLYEGKMINQFDHRFSDAKYWIDEKEGRKSILGRRVEPEAILGYQQYRIAYRTVASNTNERTMISAVLPKYVFAGHSLNLSSNALEPRQLSYACAIFNSFVYDYSIRSIVGQNLTMFFVKQVPFPRIDEKNSSFEFVTLRSAKLICTELSFNEFAIQNGLKSYKEAASDPAERAMLRAELDGIVAHLYGLSENEFAHILSTFPVVEQSVKDAALDAYRALATKPEEDELKSLIAKGESHELEFKSSGRWDMREQRANKDLEKVIVKTCAGFLNIDGGTLLIGVDDSGAVVGLQPDYALIKNKNRDGYEAWLTTLLLDAYGKDASQCIKISFHEANGNDVCKVTLTRAPRPTWVADERGEHLYVRTGNSTRQLTSKEAVEWVKRWG